MNKGALLIFIIVILIAGGAFVYYSKGNLTNALKSSIMQNVNQPVSGDPWEAIKTAVAQCRVTEVNQDHSLKVSAKLKDGTRLSATEPRIDDIINAAENAADACGDVSMMTE